MVNMELFTVGYSYSWKYNRLQGKTIRFRRKTYFLVRHFTFVTKLSMSRNLLGLHNEQKKIELKKVQDILKSTEELTTDGVLLSEH